MTPRRRLQATGRRGLLMEGTRRAGAEPRRTDNVSLAVGRMRRRQHENSSSFEVLLSMEAGVFDEEEEQIDEEQSYRRKR